MTDLRTVDVAKLLRGIKAETTIASYTNHWAKYKAFAGERAMGDPATFVAWRQHLIHETNESPNTINLRLKAVKGVLRELADQRQIAKEIYWPIQDVKTLKPNALPERRNQNFRVRIEPADMRGLVNTPEVSLTNPFSLRNRALLLVLASSGVRISEAVHIRVKDIRRAGQNYLIANILGKGAGEPRLAPLSEEAYHAIQDWLHFRPIQSEWLFNALTFTGDGLVLYSDVALSRQAAYCAVKEIARQYGMPDVKPHDFRRFVGTQLAKHDIRQAQRVLGHKSIDTTAKHYVLDDVPLGSTEGLF